MVLGLHVCSWPTREGRIRSYTNDTRNKNLHKKYVIIYPKLGCSASIVSGKVHWSKWSWTKGSEAYSTLFELSSLEYFHFSLFAISLFTSLFAKALWYYRFLLSLFSACRFSEISKKEESLLGKKMHFFRVLLHKTQRSHPKTFDYLI